MERISWRHSHGMAGRMAAAIRGAEKSIRGTAMTTSGHTHQGTGGTNLSQHTINMRDGSLIPLPPTGSHMSTGVWCNRGWRRWKCRG